MDNYLGDIGTALAFSEALTGSCFYPVGAFGFSYGRKPFARYWRLVSSHGISSGEELGLDTSRRPMRHSRKWWYFHPIRYSALVAGLMLVAIIPPVARTDAAEPITLEVEAIHGLPGLHHSALSRFLATRMTEAGIANWR